MPPTSHSACSPGKVDTGLCPRPGSVTDVAWAARGGLAGNGHNLPAASLKGRSSCNPCLPATDGICRLAFSPLWVQSKANGPIFPVQPAEGGDAPMPTDWKLKGAGIWGSVLFTALTPVPRTGPGKTQTLSKHWLNERRRPHHLLHARYVQIPR